MQGTTAIHTIEGFEPEMTTLDSLEDEMQAQIRGREARLRPKAEAEAEPPPAAPADPRPAFQPAALQKEELVLCAIPKETHELSIRLHLVESCKPAPCYLVLLPRLATHDSGHLRYSDHRIEVDSAAGVSAVDIESDHFAMYTVQRDALDRLVVRHSWRSHDVALVRKQYAGAVVGAVGQKSEALSETVRAQFTADDFSRAAKMREVLKEK